MCTADRSESLAAMKILVVEDEETTCRYLSRGLSEEGFVVDIAQTSEQADLSVHDHDYDAVLLDVSIPGEDGFSLCRRWRARGVTTPILFVTARDGLAQRVEGLNLGADDYLVKPFAFEELLARLRARLRRKSEHLQPEAWRQGSIELDLTHRQLRVDQRTVALTTREYLLLEALMRARGRVVSRGHLWECAWESGAEPVSNVVDVYIGYLRNKLGSARHQLETVRGQGYRLCP